MKFKIYHYYQIWTNRIKYLLERNIDISPIFDMSDFSKEKEDFWHKNKGY